MSLEGVQLTINQDSFLAVESMSLLLTKSEQHGQFSLKAHLHQESIQLTLNYQ